MQILKIPIVGDLIELFRPVNLRTTLILLLSSVMLVAWKTFGAQSFYRNHAAGLLGLGNTSAMAALFHIGMTLVLLGVVPACLMRFAFGASLQSMGLGAGRLLPAAVLLAITIPFILWISYANADNEDFRLMYPLSREACQSWSMFGMHVASLSLFYLGWEFHFRGFLQNGLSPSLGPFAALWVQVLGSSLLHFGRPDSEIWASIPAGLLWGLQARYTGSIWAGVAQHWLLGATLDYFICYG